MHKEIISPEKPIAEATRKLLLKKYRDREGMYLVEGEKLLKDALRFGRLPKRVFFREGMEKILTKLPDSCEQYCVSDRVIRSLTDTKTPQGIVSVFGKDILPFSVPKGKGLILDRLQDPGNLGAILRTACATGYNDVFLMNCVDAYAPKTVRAAMSAQFRLRLYEITQKEAEVLFQGDAEIYTADMHGENVFSAKTKERHLLVFGNEGQGVGTEWRRHSVKTLRLPMENDLESLNVAVSASVMMYILWKNGGEHNVRT